MDGLAEVVDRQKAFCKDLIEKRAKPQGMIETLTGSPRGAARGA